jgi:hypothetical protein
MQGDEHDQAIATIHKARAAVSEDSDTEETEDAADDSAAAEDSEEE